MAGGNPLEFIKPKPASIQLLERQLSAADPGVRSAGVDSIPKVKTPLDPLQDCLVDLLEHQNWYVRHTAIEANCTSIQFPGAAPVTIKKILGPRLAHEDGKVQDCAAAALVRIVEETDKCASMDCAEKAAREVAAKLSHQETRVRKTALETLNRMGASAKPHVQAIYRCLSDPEPVVRRRVVQISACPPTGLGELMREGVPEAARLTTHEDPAIRLSAHKACMELVKHSEKEVAEALAAQLGHEDPLMRRVVLDILYELGPLCAPHGQAIIECIEAPEAFVRYSAVRALASGGAAMVKSLKFLYKLILHQDKDIRRAAVDALRELSRTHTIFAKAVGRTLLEEPEELNAETFDLLCQVLRVLGGAAANATPYLNEMAGQLDCSDWNVRRAAIEAIEDLGEHAKGAAPQVARRLLHHEPDVRRAAAEALGRMRENCGPYWTRVQEMVDNEDDEDVLQACQEALRRFDEAGVGVDEETRRRRSSGL